MAIALGRTVAPSEKDSGSSSSNKTPGAEIVIARMPPLCECPVAAGVSSGGGVVVICCGAVPSPVALAAAKFLMLVLWLGGLLCGAPC